MATRHSLEDIRAFVRNSGFQILEEYPNEYVDCVVVIKAQKAPIAAL